MSWDLLINPLITLLTLFYSLLGNNIVLAIALLTVAIRLLVAPLMIQQQRTMSKQQELQPLLENLKEKYKNDREKLAQAQMELYREHNINPLGGCLPMLVQLPILFALYGTINHALASSPYQLVDLANRLMIPSLDPLLPLNKIWLQMDLTQTPTTEAAHAPWALALPVIVLVTTWLQSKLTMPAAPASKDGKPNPAESMTRSMTTIMPLMFGFMSLSFPIGLSIYFIVGNVLGVIQQTLMGKADWRGLVGLPPAPKPITATSTGIVSDDIVKVSSSTASRDVLSVKPSNTATGANNKNKNRKKK